ncbi:SCO7613 C-terminal domain-containing membrane protein [Actinoplanes aureus]|uniref:Uncharacterized protein n=1 Tax=Actinoplanes aureus TaxID=2792083 RepID=A0A931CII3_9ACTN|nr:hypothetical protein [Actinoplanes aureus]MBG0567953.1 hypothetical protein [Actinoplanes aureus]
MTSAPSEYPCPYCGTPASAESGCPSCGRAPDPDAIEVIRLDAEIAGLNQRLQAARAELDGIQRQLTDTTTRRNAAASRVSDAVRTTMTTAAPRPVPAPPPPPTEPRLATLTVQNVLFTLGGLLLLVAAAVFTAVAWAQVGVLGRALLLGAATAAILAVPPIAARRGLTAAAETLAAVGLLMILLDGYAAWAVDFLGVAGTPPEAYAAAVCTVTAATALGYGHLVGLTGPRVAALLIIQPALPLAMASLDPGALGWSLALTGVAALNVAVLRLRPARFRADGIGLVAYVCGAGAAGLAALLAFTELLLAGDAARAAASGGVLVLVTLVVVGAAGLSGNRPAQAITGGLLVGALGIAAGGWAVRLEPGTAALRLALVALLLSGLVALARRRLPGNVGQGPWIGALAVAAVPAVAVTGWALVAARRSVLAARPLLDAPWTETVTGLGWDLPVAAVAVVCAYLLLLPARTRIDLALAAIVLVGFLVPAAFRLPWWSAAIAGMLVAAVALALATRAAGRTTLAIRLGLGATAAGHALLAGLGRPGVAAGVCAAIALIGIGTALAVRSGPRRADAGAGALTAGLLAVPAAVWLALIAADVSPTVQVRAVFGVIVLLCAAVRLLPWYAAEALAVALLLTTASPVWALAGTDPVALYAAAALLLIAALVATRGGFAGTYASAVPVPAAVLIAATGADLAVVLVEPYRELTTIWSGTTPAVPPVAWSTVAALLLTALAAALAGLLTGRTASPALLRATDPAGNGPPSAAAPAGNRPASAADPAGNGPLSDAGPAGDSSSSAADPAGDSPPSPAGNGPIEPAGPAGAPIPNWRAAAMAAMPLIGLAIPLAFAAAGTSWPAVPISGLVVGLAGLIAAALAPASAGTLLSALLFGALAAAGLAGSTPTHGATLTALGLLVVAAAVIGTSGRDLAVRTAGWVTGAVAVGALAYTSGDAAGLNGDGIALAVLAAAAVAAALNWILVRYRPREATPVAAVAQSTAVVALFLTDSAERAAIVCTLWSTVLVVRAVLPGESRRTRFRYALAAALTVLLGWWLFLVSIEVDTPEVYTLPAAALAVFLGWLARRDRPGLPSWTAYGPALAAAFLPTLAVIAGSTSDDPQYARRLLLGVGALAVLVAGARARVQAPVVAGGGVLTLVALHEVIQFWDLVPRWVPLAVGGLLLVGIATTMEQRRRDLLRLRNAVGRMS